MSEEITSDRDFKLRTVVLSTLSSGQKIAQSMHSVVEFLFLFPEASQAWHNQNNSVICVECSDLEAFREKLLHKGIRFSEFREPDLDYALTAITIYPSKEARKITSNFKLAR